MSHKDLLVLVVASMVKGEVRKQPMSHNDSLALGVACVVRERPPTSHYNLLVPVVASVVVVGCHCCCHCRSYQ